MVRRKKAAPLTAPSNGKSRKQARRITTLFHRYTRQRQKALEDGDSDVVEHLDRCIEQLGGRTAYQRASQVSTSFFSTSKWVVGFLSRNGWLHGIPLNSKSANKNSITSTSRKIPRRNTRLLEVGAINTELLDAAAEKVTVNGKPEIPKYRLTVKAIDLHSMHPDIEEVDFLQMPLLRPLNHGAQEEGTQQQGYDVIVCSMVINSVTTPIDRGTMLMLIYHFLCPGGLCFLTLPKTCLTLSPHIDRSSFQLLLEAIGLSIVEFKESPKIFFFVAQRMMDRASSPETIIAPWEELKILHRGKKFSNDFSVILGRDNAERLLR